MRVPETRGGHGVILEIMLSCRKSSISLRLLPFGQGDDLLIG